MRVRFWFRKQQTKLTTNQGIIYANVTINKQRSQAISTGIQIEKSLWDTKKQQVLGKQNAALNDELAAVKNAMLSIKQTLQAANQEITCESIISEWLSQQKGPTSIFSIMQQHETYQQKYGRGKKGKPLTKGTFTFYATNRAYFNDFLSNSNAHTNPEMINALWLRKYETYLSTRPKKPLKQRSINSAITYLKQILNFGLANEMIKKAPGLHYKLNPAQTVEPKPLTSIEMLILESYGFSKAQQKAVDCFLFLRYTGLHYIDGFNITDSAIQVDDKGNVYLFIRRQKTEEPAYIPYHPKAKALAEKYGGLERLPFSGWWNLTVQLKNAARSCGIRDSINLGWARDTFADDCSNNMRMSDESIAGMLGHATTGQVKKYRRISITRIVQEWKG